MNAYPKPIVIIAPAPEPIRITAQDHPAVHQIITEVTHAGGREGMNRCACGELMFGQEDENGQQCRWCSVGWLPVNESARNAQILHDASLSDVIGNEHDMNALRERKKCTAQTDAEACE